jgi:MoaA/NifB/PqqE/SkfB family radical SAM enzyme
MCDRNQNGGALNPHLNLDELTLEDCKTIFPPKFVQQLNVMYMCGNHGDPIIARDTLEVFRYFRENNPEMWLGMNTNAGARSAQWWEQLAEIFGQKGAVIFSLDGLGDTNHIYRQGVDWEKCMNSARAFIDAGGRARWDFLIFEHNQHQVEEAERVAYDMGFESFTKKKTARFFSTVKDSGKESHQGYNRRGKASSQLKKPAAPYQNSALSKEEHLIQKYGSMQGYYDAVPIKCKAIDKKEIYVSAEGIVTPCCWTAGRMYKFWMRSGEDQIWDFINLAGGKDNINAKYVPINNIVEGPFFKSLKDSWGQPSCASGKAKICAQKCGIEWDPYSAQFKE